MGVEQGYQLTPYVSHSFPQSHPRRMAEVGTAKGLNPPDPATATVFEIGCAGGLNLLGMAQDHPGGTYAGIDLTPIHIEAAEKRIKAAGLSNVAVKLDDVRTFKPSNPDMRADYVVCHGVYSWVPVDAQKAILELTARLLAPNGLAYISYNTLPGWHLRNPIKDAMRRWAGDAGELTPQDRCARARWIIGRLAELSPGTPYGDLLRQENDSLARLSDGYVRSEFLEPVQSACYFDEFMREAHMVGLSFVSEADPVQSDVEACLGIDGAHFVNAISSDPIEVEQWMDIIRGRTFRQTILRRA